MRALVKRRPGEGGLALGEVPEREPEAGQAKVRVTFAGICGSDIHIRHDRIGLKLELPVVMGHEFIGEVASTGPGVTTWAVGDPVVAETAFAVCGRCLMCRTGHDNACAEKELIGYVHDGTFAPYVILPVERMHRPPGAADEPSLALSEPLAGCTHALVEQCHVSAGDVVVIAGPGTVGLLSTQIARALGATVVLCGRSPHRLRLGAELGANHIVNLREVDPEGVVCTLTGGRGCDVFVECSGAADAVALGLTLLRRRGQFLQQGLVGHDVLVSLDAVVYKELRVTGALGQRWSAWDRALDLVASDAVRLAPMVSDVLPLEKWEEGFAKVEQRRGHKVLLQPDSV